MILNINNLFFRQPYRFINTLMKYADQMEERQAMMVYNVLKKMYNPSSHHDSSFNYHQHHQDYDSSSPQFYRRKNNKQSSLEDMVRKIVMKTTMSKQNRYSEDTAVDYNQNSRSNLFRQGNLNAGMDMEYNQNSRNQYRNGNRDQYQGRNEYKGNRYSMYESNNKYDSNNKYESTNDMYDALAQELREKALKENMMKYKVEHQQQNTSPFNSQDFSEKMAALINRRHVSNLFLCLIDRLIRPQ